MTHPSEPAAARLPSFDIVIIGAGPVGLSAAVALARSGLKVAVIEKQAASALAEPACDGREIALTHRSRQWMEQLGLWSQIPPDEIAPLRAAKVLNGSARHSLHVDPGATGVDVLGYLVSNHCIRAAAHACMLRQQNITLFAGREPLGIATGERAISVRLDHTHELTARLLIAADSRFSATRRALGMAADMIDFGKTMLVCRMEHEHDHEQTAWEWFAQAQTLALLPLRGRLSSVVITVPAVHATRLQELPVEAFNREVERMFEGRLGRLRLQGARYAYPLVATWSRRFVATRTALLGDTAVGMHPVTAHGFNLGLRGVNTLTHRIIAAQRSGLDIGSSDVLLPFERQHRRDTLPLYTATNAIVRLYTDNRPLARLGRSVALRLASQLPPFRRRLMAVLTER